MSFKFIINPATYALMVTLEVIGMYLLISILTFIKAEKRRWYIGTAIIILLILLLDIFVFDYHKSTGRSLVLLSSFLIYLKMTNQIPWLKAAKQLLILFVALLVTDLSVLLIVKGLNIESMDWLYGNFSFMYAIYLGILYLLIAILSIINIERFDLRKT